MWQIWCTTWTILSQLVQQVLCSAFKIYRLPWPFVVHLAFPSTPTNASTHPLLWRSWESNLTLWNRLHVSQLRNWWLYRSWLHLGGPDSGVIDANLSHDWSSSPCCKSSLAGSHICAAYAGSSLLLLQSWSPYSPKLWISAGFAVVAWFPDNMAWSEPLVISRNVLSYWCGNDVWCSRLLRLWGILQQWMVHWCLGAFPGRPVHCLQGVVSCGGGFSCMGSPVAAATHSFSVW